MQEFQAQSESNQNLINQLNDQVQGLEAENADIGKERVVAEDKIQKLMKVNLDRGDDLKQLEGRILGNSEAVRENKALKDRLTSMEKGQDKLREELVKASDYVLEQEERVKKANETVLDTLAQLRVADSEIDALKRRVAKLQALTARYFPVRGDAVDEALADFINNYEDKSQLQVMFIRLSPGIYSFGSKKVCIKGEKGRITIRVGGGYLRIDEFLT